MRNIVLTLFVLVGAARVVAAQEEPKPVYSLAARDYSVGRNKDVVAKVKDDGKFSVTDPTQKSLVLIEVGSISVEPNTAYTGTVPVRNVTPGGVGGAWLMLREHPEKGKPAITPYNVTASNQRELKYAEGTPWVTREVRFKTGANTHALTGAIVLNAGQGEVQLGDFQLLPGIVAAAKVASTDVQAEFKAAMVEVRAKAAQRKPILPRPVVFCRSQLKYPLGMNYYHQWNDRPLLASRQFREASPYITPLSSFKRTLQEVADYDIDGLAFFPETKGRLAMVDVFDQAAVPGVKLLPELTPLGGTADLSGKIATLERMLADPGTARVDGKVLFTSYDAESLKPEQWKIILDGLRAKVGDKFVFIANVVRPVNLRTPLVAGQKLGRADVEAEQAYLRSYLDVCDGIYFNYPPAMRFTDHTFDAGFYRDVLIPIYKSVLAEPKYQGKFFGLSSFKSHMSPERGNGFWEDGTRTLRNSFEAAMEGQPDVIVLPEWDEENENTSFRPTIFGARTSERIVRYYMSRIKSKPASPLPGDDLSIPNLIVSSPRLVSLGQRVRFELLNVPDGQAAGNYQVQVTLKDAAGKVLKTFDSVTLDAAKLDEGRVFFDTESAPDATALVPSLRITGYRGTTTNVDEGIHHVQVRATWNWDALESRQPIRDLVKGAKTEASWGALNPDGSRVIKASVTSPDDLNLVELLGDDDEVYAFDAKDEFFRADASRELFIVGYQAVNNVPIEGQVSLKNAGGQWWTGPGASPGSASSIEVQGSTVTLKAAANEVPRWLYLAVPKSEVGKAEVEIALTKGKFSVPLRELGSKQMIGRGLSGGLYVSVRRYRRQIDMPQPVRGKTVNFSIPVWPEISTEQFHLRLTTMSGKIFNSRPLLLPASAGEAMKTLRVYSEGKKGPVDLQVAASRIPELTYDWQPERGDVLLTKAGQPFWGTLGGFSAQSTGRGTGNGLFRRFFPQELGTASPAWVMDVGEPGLEFDGKATYVELPRESLPWRGAFTLDFQVKPKNSTDQTLMVNRTTSQQMGLMLQIKNGKLVGSFKDADWKTIPLGTNIPVHAGQWSKIRVRYDFEKMTFTVNGESVSIPVKLPASNIGFTIFGESWTGKAFEGRMRGIRIFHGVG